MNLVGSWKAGSSRIDLDHRQDASRTAARRAAGCPAPARSCSRSCPRSRRPARRADRPRPRRRPRSCSASSPTCGPLPWVMTELVLAAERRQRLGRDADVARAGSRRSSPRRAAAARCRPGRRRSRPMAQSANGGDEDRLDRVHAVLGLVEDDRCRLSNTSSVTSISEMPNFSSISLPTLVSVLWNAGRQCMNLTLRVAGLLHQRLVDLVGREQLDALRPDLLRLRPSTPTRRCGRSRRPSRPRRRSSVISDAGAGLGGDLRAISCTLLVRPRSPSAPPCARRMPSIAPHDQQRVAHVVAGVAEEGIGDLGARLVGVLDAWSACRPASGSGATRRSGRCRPARRRICASSSTMPWPEPRNSMASYMRPSTRAVSFIDSLWPIWRAARVEVGDVRALVVGGDLEGAARAGRGLLEDQADLLARRALGCSVRAYLARFRSRDRSSR